MLVAVDGFTSLGGAQWIDSPAIGDYGRYLCDDVVGFVDAQFRTLPEAPHRGLAGTSSGGFGAMVWSMLRPDLFGGFATHAGDALFDVTLGAELAPAAQALRNLYDGSFEAFWADFRSGRPVFENRTDPLLQNVYATAAAFSPRPTARSSCRSASTPAIVAPRGLRTLARLGPGSHGPETRRRARRAARRSGSTPADSDEYRLDLGAIAFRDAVVAAGAAADVLHFELFDGGHRRLGRRLAESLPHLAKRLAGL